MLSQLDGNGYIKVCTCVWLWVFLCSLLFHQQLTHALANAALHPSGHYTCKRPLEACYSSRSTFFFKRCSSGVSRTPAPFSPMTSFKACTMPWPVGDRGAGV